MRRGRSSTRKLASLALACLGSLATAPDGPAQGQDPLETQRSQMNLQGNPVDRARAFPRYGQALIKAARDAATAGDYERAEKLLTEYRDTVKQLHESLKGRVPNPERSPNGFKQLQIHVRKTLKDIEDLVASVPASLQPPFDFLRKEIDRLDRALIDDLFPRQPGRDEKKAKQ